MVVLAAIAAVRFSFACHRESNVARTYDDQQAMDPLVVVRLSG